MPVPGLFLPFLVSQNARDSEEPERPQWALTQAGRPRTGPQPQAGGRLAGWPSRATFQRAHRRPSLAATGHWHLAPSGAGAPLALDSETRPLAVALQVSPSLCAHLALARASDGPLSGKPGTLAASGTRSRGLRSRSKPAASALRRADLTFADYYSWESHG